MIGSQRATPSGASRLVAKTQKALREPTATDKIEVPNIRRQLSPDLEAEVAAAIGDYSLQDMMNVAQGADAPEPEVDSTVKGKVTGGHRDVIFVQLGGRFQGFLAARQFPTPPAIGSELEVAVRAFDAEQGMYQLSLPGGAVDVGGWNEISKGMVVEARITGHNAGGLECDVNNLRGFIPASQISTYRIEDFSPLVGEKLTCMVTEVNFERKNLVLSRRAVMEQEAAAAKEKTMASLAEEQVREGVVRSIQDFGAFVDLGGVDGLLHVSQLSWKRVAHPKEILEVGQRVQVKVRKIDAETGKISLSLKELLESPWSSVAQKYHVTSVVRGVVTRIMDFGAFVEIEPGVEGLVHISQLAHGRVFRVSDVVKQGQEVEAKVVSIDMEKQRIGLSIKEIMAKPLPAKPAEPEEEEPEETPATTSSPKSTKPLKGGLGRSSGGERFGLKW